MSSAAAAPSSASRVMLPQPASSRVWRWGILGAGAISTDFCHALHLHVRNAVIAIVGARDPQTAVSLSSRYGSGRVGSYAEVCGSEDVDVVYVGTVHTTHRQLALLAVSAGKHVLVEKPFCLNAAEAGEVVAAARARHVFCMEAMWVRCMPWWEAMQRQLSSGALGRIRHVISDFSCRFPAEVTRAFDPSQGGGSLLDIGVYPLYLASAVYGQRKPQRVQAVAALTPQGVDASLAVTLQWGEEGGLAQLFSSVEVDGPRQVHVIGTRGRLLVHDDSEGAGRHWYGSTRLMSITQADDGRQAEHWQHFPLLWEGEEGAAGWRGEHRVLLAYEAAHVQSRLDAGELESDRMPLDETLQLMRVMDDIRAQCGVVYPTERQ